MAVTWLTPSDVTPGTDDTWEDRDVSGSVPAGATGVILQIYVDAAVTGAIGWRKNGSTDARTQTVAGNSLMWVAIGVDGSRIFEAYVDNKAFQLINLVGYFTDDAVFATNATEKVPGSTGSWVDIDISGQTGGDTAIAAIFEIVNVDNGETWGLRKNGSTDDRVYESRDHAAAIIGVDGSEICEVQISDVDVDLFLVGYIISDAIFNTNATDLSLTAYDTWTDLSALPAGATGGIIEGVITVTVYRWGLRENGSAQDYYEFPGGYAHAWGMVECDGSRLIEGQADNSAVDFYLTGYTTAAAAAAFQPYQMGRMTPAHHLQRGLVT